MPKDALVTIKYGPYKSCGMVEHRTFRLEGLQAVLKADGHRIILEQIPYWNEVQLIVNGETVFQCNINDLDFGGEGVLDPLCQAARIAVLNAY
ncbi:UPF0728 protein C10orf53 homolog [Pogona vitticeps]